MKVSEIARITNGELIGDGETEVTRVAALRSASKGDLAFVEVAAKFEPSGASCLLVPKEFGAEADCILIKVENPKLEFARIARLLAGGSGLAGWHPTASVGDGCDVRARFIGAFATIGDGSSVGQDSEIHAGARIGRDVSIGERTVIYPNCVIYDNVTIGDDCVLHAGAVIGADGFGYVRGPDGYVQFPQIGTVIIENDVEIGAGSCVDRGALGETRIGEGTKIDNLVQIAHNVTIGKRVVIAAQTGISGSTEIEDDCVIGGQVGMGDHARVLSGAVIGSQAGVLPGKIVRPGVWWGTPVQPLEEYKRQNALVKGLGRLREEVKELKKKLV